MPADEGRDAVCEPLQLVELLRAAAAQVEPYGAHAGAIEVDDQIVWRRDR